MGISFAKEEYGETERGINNGRVIRLGLMEDGSKVFGSQKLYFKTFDMQKYRLNLNRILISQHSLAYNMRLPCQQFGAPFEPKIPQQMCGYSQQKVEGTFEKERGYASGVRSSCEALCISICFRLPLRQRIATVSPPQAWIWTAR